MKTTEFRLLYNYKYRSERAKEKMQDVSIQFSSQPKKKSTAADDKACNLNWLAWTYRNLEAKHIYINQIFHDRLENLSDEENEREAIILMMSFLIIHEVGHLLIKFIFFVKAFNFD